MNDRLLRLGARLLGQAPTLAPRLASRFESGASEPHAIGPLAPPRGDRLPAPPSPAPIPQAPARAESARSRPAAEHPRPHSGDPPTHFVPDAEPPASSPSPARPLRAEATPRRPAPAPSGDHPDQRNTTASSAPLVAPRDAPPLPASDSPPKPTDVSRVKPRSPASDTLRKRDLEAELNRLRSWIDRSDGEPDDTAVPVPDRPQPTAATVRAPAIQRPSPSETVPETLASATPAPAPAPIEITIGTILVRATSPATQAAARPPAPAHHAATGLSDFLARRSAGLP